VILLDGALPQGVRQIEANLKAQGMAIRDVKYILSTEPHYDHAAGIAALQRDSGAMALASAATQTLREGGNNPRTRRQPIAPSRAHQDPGDARWGEHRFGRRQREGGGLARPFARIDGLDMARMRGRVCKQVVFVASINAAAPGFLSLFRAGSCRAGGVFPWVHRAVAAPALRYCDSHPPRSMGMNPQLDPKAVRGLPMPLPRGWTGASPVKERPVKASDPTKKARQVSHRAFFGVQLCQRLRGNSDLLGQLALHLEGVAAELAVSGLERQLSRPPTCSTERRPLVDTRNLKLRSSPSDSRVTFCRLGRKTRLVLLLGG
jgi:hypothetical protein